MGIIHGSLVVLAFSFFAHAQFIVANTNPEPQGLIFFNRSSFPKDFIFGTASSAYQYEGAAFEYGKGPSLWDNFTHEYPDRIADRKNGDIALDFYHNYKEDVRRNKDLNMDAFRFSISWPRILPHGKLSGGKNQQGIDFYNNLINYTISQGLKPFVTLFHWDTPQALEDLYGGFLSHLIVDDFKDFVDLCFKEFGDRVKYWITLNEPWTYSAKGYNAGIFAPGRCSKWINEACQAGNSSTEPYNVTHHLLLSHAAAFKIYRQKYQPIQGGKIGITLVSYWMVPDDQTIPADVNAKGRALDFMLGWYLEPLTSGEYPLSMRELVGERLPNFTKRESLLINGSFDFLGLNYYTAFYVKNFPNPVNISYSTDSRAKLNATNSNGTEIGPQGGSDWLHVYPEGLKDLLIYVKENYKNPPIYVTENGVDGLNKSPIPTPQALNDTMRIDYYSQHLLKVHESIEEGVNVKGYFAWSLLDNFEWSSGYTVRFGLYFVNFELGLRFPKNSTTWLGNFLKKELAR